MLDNEPTGGANAPAQGPTTESEPAATPRRRRATKKAAAPAETEAQQAPETTDAGDKPAKRTRKAAAKKATAGTTAPATSGDGGTDTPSGDTAPAAPAKRARRSAAKKAAQGSGADGPAGGAEPAAPVAAQPPAAEQAPTGGGRGRKVPPPATVTFLAPEVIAAQQAEAAAKRASNKQAAKPAAKEAADTPDEQAPKSRSRRRKAAAEPPAEEPAAQAGPEADEDDEDSESRRRRRRGRRGRGRKVGEDGEFEADAEGDDADHATDTAGDQGGSAEDEDDDGTGTGARRRRRRRRRSAGGGDGEDPHADDPPNTVVKVREARAPRERDIEDEIQSVKGSTRLEAKRQRRREGRESGRRRPPILSEAEFLARRESVERLMVVRQRGEVVQIGVLEDNVLVEHYVSRSTSTSYAGNVYLGKVQNVLPSMEAAFVDIGKGRNAVLYAGEVNWDAVGMEGRPRQIEQALKGGQSVLVQVTKDPVGHKGARLTSQVSLPGRYLVYVPQGSMTGISRKLPDTERKRLKDILKRIVPENAGVIIRTAAEGASEDELARDITRLEAQWQTIKAKADKGQAPALLYSEPDLVIRVVRDIFNEDFAKLVVSGNEAWDMISQYVSHVSPDLADRLHKHTAQTDAFHDLRIDEQLTKALDRKVWLPSGGSLVIDRTEAMTVVDVNTGKFTGGSGSGNLEETVTRNNLEAAEEIVRQLRLRDIGGIIVIDFIDMVLESNRELVLRRLMECLGRDRTKHQVAEVTSLGLVQMTRKRVGQGLLEAFSETCEHCKGRGIIVHLEPLGERRGGGNGRKSEPARPAARAAEPEPSTVPVQAALADEPEDLPEVVDEASGSVPGAMGAEEIEMEAPPVAAAPKRRTRRRVVSRPAGPPAAVPE